MKSFISFSQTIGSVKNLKWAKLLVLMNNYERPNQGMVSSNQISRNLIFHFYSQMTVKIGSEFRIPFSESDVIREFWISHILEFHIPSVISKISWLNSMRMRNCDVTNLPFSIHFCILQPDFCALFLVFVPIKNRVQ